jgi:hypothetical protein
MASLNGTPNDATPTACSEADPTPAKEPIRRFDFGFLPIPTRLRYDSDKPFHFGLGLNIFFGLASTLSENFVSGGPACIFYLLAFTQP